MSGNAPLADIRKSQENTIVDMGDDEFTQGRPHPMIDPSQKDGRIHDEIADPNTAVVLFDIVLGYGSADDPTAGLLSSIGSAHAKARAPGRTVAFILKAAGVLVASSNAEAAVWSAALIAERGGKAQ